MRIIQNERRIKTLSKAGRTIPWVALLALAVGLVLSFLRPELVWATFLALVVGLVLSVIGGYYAERYAGPLAHHIALPRALKGLNDRYLLAEYILPAEHVLLSPDEVTVFLVKSQPGAVTYADGRWSHHFRGKFFRQIAGMESLGTPHIEAQREAHKFKRWLEKTLPDANVPVQTAIVFVSPKVELQAEGSPVPAFYGKKVKGWLRDSGSRGDQLTAEDYQRIREAIEASA
ncbi:MAG: NERD domain-containing protein [Anaerolineales bacterium]|nr:NERD domain-containing protein [Anaerolineales bacterium]